MRYQLKKRKHNLAITGCYEYEILTKETQSQSNNYRIGTGL